MNGDDKKPDPPTEWIPPRQWPHTCCAVDRTSPSDRKRLAEHLAGTYRGKLKPWERKALADVIAMTHNGSVDGFWGSLQWVHLNGAFESGDVFYEWVA